MKMHLFFTFLILIILTSTIVFAQGMNTTETVESTVQTIGKMLKDMSPLLLIGLGVLLIFIQKFARIAGIILIIVGLVRLGFMFF
jgi:hypothetical protein